MSLDKNQSFLGFWNLFVDYEYNIFYNKRRKEIFSNIAPGALQEDISLLCEDLVVLAGSFTF